MRRAERVCVYYIAAMVATTAAGLASEQQQSPAQTAQTPAASAETVQYGNMDNSILLPEVALQPLPQVTSSPGPLVTTHDIRVAKCRLLVSRL